MATHDHEPKLCRSCSAEILWCQVIDENGQVKLKPDGKPRVMPVDFAPSGAGNVRVCDRNGTIVERVLTEDEVEQEHAKAAALGTEARLRTAHFAGCPDAKNWRKR